jgi:hypothetical protein
MNTEEATLQALRQRRKHKLQFGITVLDQYVVSNWPVVLKKLGPNQVRLQASNTTYETSPGVYNFAALDTIMNILVGAGCDVVLPLQDFAEWNEDPNTELPTPAGMISWGTQLINRYGQVIAGLELGNEEFTGQNLSAPNRDPSIYAGIISQVYPALRYVARTQAPALNDGFTLGMFGFTKYDINDPTAYFHKFMAVGGGQFVDYFQFHLYSGLVGPTLSNPNSTAPPLVDMVHIVNNAQVANGYIRLKPIRIGEFGWQGIDTGGCQSVVGTTLQTQYTIQACNLIQNDSFCGNVTHMYQYTMDAIDAGHTDCHECYGNASFAPLSAFYQSAIY